MAVSSPEVKDDIDVRVQPRRFRRIGLSKGQPIAVRPSLITEGDTDEATRVREGF